MEIISKFRNYYKNYINEKYFPNFNQKKKIDFFHHHLFKYIRDTINYLYIIFFLQHKNNKYITFDKIN